MFLPFKFVLATNSKPIVHGTDHAIWRRIHLIPFNVTFRFHEQDKQLIAKLKTELPGRNQRFQTSARCRWCQAVSWYRLERRSDVGDTTAPFPENLYSQFHLRLSGKTTFASQASRAATRPSSMTARASRQSC